MSDKIEDVVPKTVAFKGKAKTYTLHEPSIVDCEECEEVLGAPLITWFGDDQKGLGLKNLIYLVWVCARKDGLTQEQIKAKQWTLDLDAFKDDLSPALVFSQVGPMKELFILVFGAAASGDEPSSEPADTESEAGRK